MSIDDVFQEYLAQCPLIAIIRGVRPHEAEAVGTALFEAGVRIIEVPLNSPEPLASIQRLAACLGDRALIGAGTVLKIDDVARVQEAGGRIIVSPSTNADVIAATRRAGLISLPGFFTPTEAFSAAAAGAHALKLFPAEAASPAVVKAHRAVLPRTMPLLVVGGIAPATMAAYMDAGADGFGLGSGVYRPGQSPAVVKAHAVAYVEAVKEIRHDQ